MLLHHVKKLREEKRKTYLYSLLYLTTCLPLPVLLISSCGFKLLSDIISFNLKDFCIFRIPLVFLVSLLATNLSGNVLFYLQF